MIVPEYAPGDWTAVVRPGFVALLGPQVAESTVRAVWDAAPGGVLDVLAVLARDGLGALPPFALVAAAPTGVHVALRGEVEVALGGQVLTAGAVSTWTERVVDGVDAVDVRRAGGAALRGGLPIADGVVRAGAVRVVLAAAIADADVARAAGPEPAPVPVPGLRAPEAAAPPEPALAAPTLVPEPAPPVEPALAPQPAPPTEPADAAGLTAAVPLVPLGDDTPDDDHDGMTILSADLVALRDQLPAWAVDDAPAPFRVAEPVATPSRIVLSTGTVVDLDRAVLVGRAPQVTRVANSELPHLVAVPSPQQDISRTHAEVRAEGGLVLVTDLDSTNGVHVSRPGEGARRLHPGEPTVVEPGEVVDLGDGVTFVVERSA